MSKRDEFVNIARSQIGVRESGVNNVKYNTWYYGHAVNGTAGTSEYAWCVTFECWCAYKVGILGSLIPKCNNVGILKNWYKAKGLYHLKETYTPQKGDLIVFKNASHTGIVERVESGRIWTIEGNSKDKVSNNSYNLTDSYIQGYCKVKFNDNVSVNKPKESTIKTIQASLNSKYGTGIEIDGIYGKETSKAFVKALQKEINKQFNTDLTVDGIFGTKTKAKCPTLRIGSNGDITQLVQEKLICLGYNIKADKIYGQNTESAIIEFQRSHNLVTDGICGKNTFEKLFNL